MGSGDPRCGHLLLPSLVNTRTCHVLYFANSKQFDGGEARVEVGKPGGKPGVYNVFLFLL